MGDARTAGGSRDVVVCWRMGRHRRSLRAFSRSGISGRSRGVRTGARNCRVRQPVHGDRNAAHADLGQPRLFSDCYWRGCYIFRQPATSGTHRRSLGGIYRAVSNKYYVDEIYAALFVKPLLDGSTTILWHGIDQGVIDAAVNESADAARQVSDARAAHAIGQSAFLCGMGRCGRRPS